MSDTEYFSGAGVLFIEDFDEEPAPPQPAIEAPPEPAPIVYTAEDMEMARQEGRLLGAEEARTDHEAMQSALCNAALAAIGDGLASGRADAARVAETRAQDIAAAVLALLGAALPATASRLATQEIDALLEALLPPLSHAPGVRVRVHPDMLEAISARLSAYDGVSAHADAAMAPSDVAIVWQDGQARRDWAALWAQITTALTPFALPAELAQPLGG